MHFQVQTRCVSIPFLSSLCATSCHFAPLLHPKLVCHLIPPYDPLPHVDGVTDISKRVPRQPFIYANKSARSLSLSTFFRSGKFSLSQRMLTVLSSCNASRTRCFSSVSEMHARAKQPTLSCSAARVRDVRRREGRGKRERSQLVFFMEHSAGLQTVARFLFTRD